MGPGIQFKALALHARGPRFNFKFKEKKMEVFHVKNYSYDGETAIFVDHTNLISTPS